MGQQVVFTGTRAAATTTTGTTVKPAIRAIGTTAPGTKTGKVTNTGKAGTPAITGTAGTPGTKITGTEVM